MAWLIEAFRRQGDHLRSLEYYLGDTAKVRETEEKNKEERRKEHERMVREMVR